MQNKDNKSKRIYLKATRDWVEVPEDYYKDHNRYCNTFRKRRQSHGQCACPKNKFWLCDVDCYNCEFHRAGDMLSIDYATENKDGDLFSMLDKLADTSPSIEEVVTDQIMLDMLFQRLAEIIPEARCIGDLRMAGLSDGEIADKIGIPRTTFLSRLKKAKEILQREYPDLF